MGPVPSAGDRWAGGDRWVNHWVIESVTSKGQGIPPGDRPLLGQCIPPEGRSGYVGNTSFGVAFTDQAINMTQTGWNVGGKGTIGGATGPVELGGEVNGGYSSSTSKSTSKTLSLTGQVDCSQYGDPGPGKVWKFYQGYQRLEWTGRWELYRCSLFGCEKKDEQKVRGIYWVPLSVALGRPEPL